MFGTFQQSTVRVQVAATASTLKRCLTDVSLMRQWAVLQSYPSTLPKELTDGLEFTSTFGLIPLGHRVSELTPDSLKLVLWGGVDGYTHWHWGDGWVQLTVAGVSLIPLALGQTVLLESLVRFATNLDQAVA
jgi:hypothetical protein